MIDDDKSNNYLIWKFVFGCIRNDIKKIVVLYFTKSLFSEHLLKCNLLKPCTPGNTRGAGGSVTFQKIGVILVQLSTKLLIT